MGWSEHRQICVSLWYNRYPTTEVASRCVTTRGRGRYLKGGIDMAGSACATVAPPAPPRPPAAAPPAPAPPPEPEGNGAVGTGMAGLAEREMPAVAPRPLHPEP